MEKLIEVFNLGGLPTAPLDSFLELQEDFKKSDPDKLSKLQMLICHAMEIDPRYVSATVSRYRAMFPEQVIRLIRSEELMTAEETLKLIV